ncbi:hypothetical protein ACFV7Q_27765 [Streptomyces sp. NPDC059851]|uniref:hypothetical protein n=1 Tax=Streptomyces sp. NPDC059851 TaxID=3346971 RepID=UPI0036566BC5
MSERHGSAGGSEGDDDADRGDHCEDALHDADDDTAGCAASVLFEIELALEGLVDRLDDLRQRLEQGRSELLRLASAGRAQQPDVPASEPGTERDATSN